jgi:sulfatase modifying factor 1
MNTHARLLIVAVLFAAFSLTSQSYAQPLVTIETVTVGDAGNASDSNGYGAVTNVFAIGKYEVTISQYTAFLNSVAQTNTNSYIVNLWSADMATDLNIAGISRSGSGTVGSPYSYSVIGSGNRPITYVSWFDAARFANWMHNGATNGASTEIGAYTLNGAAAGITRKNIAATWWIPSEDEWYKAAYYKGGGTNAGYWPYPTQSDSAPGNRIGGAANQANYHDGDYAVTQSASFSNAQNYLTEAGVFSNSGSAYGTFDQAGNVWEWNDAVFFGNERVLRGGSWYDYGTDDGYLRSSFRYVFPPWSEFRNVGFRVASGTGPLPPALALEQPSGTGVTNNTPASSFGAVLIGETSANRSYTLRNAGGAALNITSFALAGSNPADFQIVPLPTNSLAGGGVTDFSVSFAPTGDGLRTAQISIVSNDTNNSPFIINLSGTGLLPPVLAVEQPSGTGITNNAPASSFGAVLVGATSSNRSYTVRNAGGAALNIASFAVSGSNPADFQIVPLPTNSLAGGSVTDFSVSFAPTASGSKTAQVSIVSNDTNNSPFIINLSGFALGEQTDTDGDGLNDAAEFTMSALGFNWEVAQTNLVGTLYTNANRAKLYSETQYNANRTNGRTDVISNPSIYNLYTSNSIMDLRMGGLMVQRQGSSATVIFQPQTTIDLSQPFTNNGTPITNAIPMPGDKGFIRIRANPTPSP